jgi:hypothetical protein
MRDRMPKSISKKYQSALGSAFEKINPANYTDEVLASIDPRELVDTAINSAMRGAAAAEKEAVRSAAIKGFSDRSVALELTRKLVPSNINNQVSAIRPDRILTRPLSNLWNKGTLNTLQNKPLTGHTSPIPTSVRAIVDALSKKVFQ